MSTSRVNGRRRDESLAPGTRRVVIVGGGITGLSAAYFLQRDSAAVGLPLTITLLEAGDDLGGKIATRVIEPPGAPPFIVEHGADALLTRKPWAVDLVRELGLEDRVLPVNRAGRTFVLRRGRLIPLPDGLTLLVPSKLLPFLRSPLFSPWGKLRVLLEPLIPPRRSDADESLADFVRRRLGREALDVLAEPLLAGIYNAEPERQSLLATFPQFPAMERQHGSLLRAAWATRAAPAPDRQPAFISFPGGLVELIRALQQRVAADLRTRHEVTDIRQRPGGGFDLTIATPDAERSVKSLSADAVILTTPANVAANLLATVAPRAADQLAAIRYAGIASASLGFRRDDVPHPLDGLGVVIPPRENRRIDGITFSSTKWPGRVPDGYALLRVFFGGPHSRDTLALDDDRLIALIRQELKAILGISAEPLFTAIHRWPSGYPQYDVGHLQRVAAIEAVLPAGLAVAGNAYRGIGVPDCIRQARDAARCVLADLRERSPAGSRNG